MAAGPRAPAAGGGRRWRRRRSGGVEVAWSGQEASPRHEGASGVLDLGRGRKEERLHGEQGGGASGYGSGMAPVEIGRGGWVGELRGPTIELSRGSARAEEGCSGGIVAASSSPGLQVDGGGVLGSGG